MENESEKLLETLLDLERALQREQNLRRISETILKALRGINEAQDTEELFSVLVDTLRSLLEFDDAFILQAQPDGYLRALETTSPRFAGTVWQPFSLFKRVLTGCSSAVFDIENVAEWAQMPATVRKDIKSALHVYLNDGQHGSILVCTHHSPKHFGPLHVKDIGYFTPLTSQALRSLMNMARLRQAREEMLRTQKLESLGILAGGIAHDFNNILMVILGNLSLARKQINNTGKLNDRISEAEKAANRAKDLARQLLTFSKGGEPVKKTLDVSHLIKEAGEFAIHGTAVKCKLELSENLCTVEADEGQLSQVIHNLVINAVQAMPEGGTVTVKVDNLRSEITGKNHVIIAVEDTGGGIPDEHLQKVFDPFFTTKEMGSGLGLATCHSIIKKHGGEIHVESTPGKGSKFTVILPASDTCKIEIKQRQADISTGHGSILVMDDEPMVRKVVKAMLEELGYSVECCENSADTLELYQKRMSEGRNFSAVILDLTIPGEAGGSETITMLKEMDLHVKAIASSGYSENQIMSNFRDYGFIAIICKPYRLEEISRVMREINSVKP